MTEVLDLRQSREANEDGKQPVEDFCLKNEPPKKKNFPIKTLVVIVLSIAITTLGIRASDSLFGPNGESEDSLCSDNMVFIPNSSGGFCIDKFEASTSKNCPNLNPSDQASTRENLNIDGCIPESKKDVIPWRNISQNQAALACAKAGKRLPTNKEWLQASLGTPDKNADWGSDDCQLDNNWGSQPGFSGSGEKCVSAVGAYDMIGNVWEWVEETIDNGKYKGIELPEKGFVKGVDSYGMPMATAEESDLNYNKDFLWIKKTGVKGILKGGFWGNKYEGGVYSTYLVFEPSFFGDSVGFRCVK